MIVKCMIVKYNWLYSKIYNSCYIVNYILKYNWLYSKMYNSKIYDSKIWLTIVKYEITKMACAAAALLRRRRDTGRGAGQRQRAREELVRRDDLVVSSWTGGMGYSLSGAKFPDLFVFAWNFATRGHATPPRPHPLPYPMGRFPHPQTHVGEPFLGVRTHRRAYRTLGMGGQNGHPAENFLPNSYHGHYRGFPYQTISDQFTIVMRYCTDRWSKS